MHIEIVTSFSPYQLPEELIRVKFDGILSCRQKMNLFGVLVYTLVLAEGWSFRYPQEKCPPATIQFGRVRYRQRNRIARFLCNTGYMLAGDRYSVCAHGKWDNSFPKCVRATCQKANPPINGLIYPSHGGGVLNFFCMSHFQLRGANITYCDGHRWDNPLPTCLPTNSTPPLSCDFEGEDLCGWNHDLNHDFEWKRLNYATPSGAIGTGPSHDHTKGAGKDGYYMYIESSARNINDTARLISPVYDAAPDPVCFEFYYHMYGATTGSLRVYLKKVTQSWDLNPSSALFSRDGNQGNKWYRGLVVLGPVADEFQIVVEGVRGSSYVSDIAIDDVRIIRNCSPEDEVEQSTTAEPASSEPPITVESCEHRCNLNDTQSSEWTITCDCDEQCFDRNRCCPDYFDFCVVGSSTDVEETTELSTTTIQIPTTRRIITTARTTTSTPLTTFIRVILMTTTTPAHKEESKIVYVKPDDRDYDEVTVIEDVDVETPPPVKETEPINDYENDKFSSHQNIVVGPKTEESKTKTIVFAVGVVFGVLFSVVGTAFVAKRYQLCRCNRLSQSSNGDSQSDVRFLTGDEVLDFSLASDYDTM